MKTTLSTTTFFLFALAVLGIPAASHACSCGEFPSFCEKAVTEEKILVEIINHQTATYPGGDEEYFTQVKVLFDLDQGGYADTISLVNQNGVNCNDDISQYLAGDSLIVSIPFVEIVSWPEELSGVPPYPTYDLFGCGTYFLAVDNGKLGGGNTELVSLEAFLNDPFNNCPIINSTEEADPFGQVQLTPNPVEQDLNVFNLTTSTIQFQLHTIDGRPLLSIELRAKQVGTIPMSDLPPGVYIVRQVAGPLEHSQFIIKH